LNSSANLFCGLFIKAKINPIGTNPSTLNKIIPGIKKLLKGELSNIDKGIPNSLPDGEIINMVPPKIAPNPRSANKKIRRFLSDFGFIKS
jgi:hypothetical protein